MYIGILSDTMNKTNENDIEIISEVMEHYVNSFEDICFKYNIDYHYNLIGMYKAFNLLLFKYKKSDMNLENALRLYEALYNEGIIELIELFKK